MTNKINIFWFRQDLRICDNPGLLKAAKSGKVLAIYILDEENPGSAKLGGASKWWLHHSLISLSKSLNNKLNIYHGNSKEVLLRLLAEHDVAGVYWNRCYEPWRITTDTAIKSAIKKLGVECESYNGTLLWEPWDILKKDDTAYKVFTYFYRNGCLQAALPRNPIDKPEKLFLIKDQKNKTTIKDLYLLYTGHKHQKLIKWYKDFAHDWAPGESAAKDKLDDFIEHSLSGYKNNRNYPSKCGTSRLSPHLHFGEISPHQIWYKAQVFGQINHKLSKFQDDLDCFLSEIGWREFSYYLLYHFPSLPYKNFQEKFNAFNWADDRKALIAWQRGKTGYPIIDAGMRELRQTGYMHNRVRMIVGSFLVKNLLIHWHQGERWFWDCLLDADLASNSASWQWVAGSGADAAPYFRIFNPVLQGEKFDQNGEYIRRFIPELKNLPNKYISKPWEAPEKVLKEANITLGQTYPHPIIDLSYSRERALQVYKKLKSE